MAINFPSSPTDGDLYSAVGRTWQYDATASAWKSISESNITVAGLGIPNHENISVDSSGNTVLSGNFTPDANITYDLGSATNRWRDLYLSGNSIELGSRTITADNVPEVDLAIAPEVLEIQVSAPAAGQATSWLWTWEQSTLPYARRTITNSPEVSVPLYKQGTYTINNYAAYDIFDQMTQTHSLYLKWIDGAGTDNLVSWAVNASGNPISDSHPDINGGNATDVQRINISVPATITLPTLTAPSVSYTVVNNGSGAYTFSGSAAGDNPNLGPFYRGGTYTINITATGHPFYFTTDNGTNFSAGTYFGEYTDGVTGSRTDSGTITFTVPSDAPDTLYYQCGNHAAMFGAITIKDLAVEVNNNGNYVIYAQHTQEGHKTPIELRPIPSLVNQMCLVYDASVNRFVPQDLATYVENTPSFENKIREVAGTAELVVEDGSAVVAKVNVYPDSTYLPLVGNNAGDQAFATDINKLFIWDGSSWQQAGSANTDELTEGSTNLYYTDARVSSYLAANDFDTATNIVATITDSAPTTLDTLNELAAALNDDPNFATTTANSIATKLPLSGGTLTGNLTVNAKIKATTGTNEFWGNGNASLGWGDTSSIGYLSFDTNANPLIRSDSGKDLFFQTNGPNNRMVITSSGDVGIGTTTPQAGLEVGTSSSGLTKTVIVNQEGGNEIGLKVKARTNRASLQVQDNDSTAYVSAEDGYAIYGQHLDLASADMVINAAGDVGIKNGSLGIGTDVPSHMLEIKKSDATVFDPDNIPTDGSGATILINNTDTANGPSYSGINMHAYGASSNVTRGFIGIVNDENPYNGGWSGTDGHLSFGIRGRSFGNVIERATLDSEGNFTLKGQGALKTEQSRHSVQPTLNLDFANGKELDSRITFYRKSIGTYYDSKGVLRYAKSNEPRFDHDPVTGESKGLLMEESRTNICPDLRTWITSSSAHFEHNTTDVVAPDGTFSAIKVFRGPSANYQTFYTTGVNVTNGTTYTFSWYGKENPDNPGKWFVQFNINGWQNITFLSSQFPYNDATQRTTDVGNGWYRFEWTFTSLGTGNPTFTFHPHTNNTSAGDTTQYQYYWGAQLEVGDFATSYIPSNTKFTSRASSATYFDSTGALKTAGRNQPRYGYKYNGRKWVDAGLILEDGNTQLFNTSDAYDWPSYSPRFTKQRTSDYFSCGQEFTKIIPDTTSSSKVYDKYESLPSTGTYCFSVFAKASGYKNIDMYMSFNTGGGNASFDLETGTITSSGSQNVGIEDYGNGIYRCYISDTITQTGGLIQRVQVRDNSNQATYIGDGTSGVELFGMQLESGYTPTSLIFGHGDGTTYARSADVVSSYTQTRTEDNAYITDMSWFNDDNSTVYQEVAFNKDLSGFARLGGSIIGKSGNNFADIGVFYSGGGGGAIQSIIRTNATSQATGTVLTASDHTLGEFNKFALTWTGNGDDFATISNGSYGDGLKTDNSYLLDEYNRLEFFAAVSYQDKMPTGHIKKFVYYPARLTNEEIQALTENN